MNNSRSLNIFYIIFLTILLFATEASLMFSDTNLSTNTVYYSGLIVVIVLLYLIQNRGIHYSNTKRVIQILLYFCIFGILTSFIIPFPALYYYPVILLPLFIFLFSIQICKTQERDFFTTSCAILTIFLAIFYLKNFNIELFGEPVERTSANYPILYLLPFVLILHNNIIKYILILVIFLCLFVSLKRGGIIAFTLALITYYLVDASLNSTRKSKTKNIVVSIIFLIVLLLLFLKIDSIFGDIFSARLENIEEDGGSGRIEIYSKVCHMIVDKTNIIQLIFGHGWNAVLKDNPLQCSAHNDFLELMYDTGLIGIICYISLLVWLFKEAKKQKIIRSSYSAAFYASIVLFIFNTSVSHIVLYPQYFCLFLMFWGTAITQRRNKSKELS